MSNCGYNFTWISSDCDTPPDNVLITSLPFPTYNFLEQTLGIPWPIWHPNSWLCLQREVAKAELVWLHDSLYFGNILAFLAAKLQHKPILITQHIGIVPYRNRLLRWLMKSAKICIGDQLLRHADRVVFISDRVMREEAQRLKFAHSPSLIPNGVDVLTFKPVNAAEKKNLRERMNLDSGQKVVLFVGRFVEKKGLHILRELANSLPAHLWILAGSGAIDPDDWNLPNVRVVRGRHDTELAQLYQISDLLVLPSFGEGFPLVIQEAMACGVPVLCSSETADGSEAGRPLLNTAPITENVSETANLWRNKVIKVLSGEAHSDSCQLAEFARQEWQWDRSAERYHDLVTSIIVNK